MFGGYGNPGGTVSLVRKRPREEFAFKASILGGSWDQKRIELDVTGPLARDGAFRGRAVAMYSNQHYFYELAKRERAKIFGVLEYDLSPQATLTAGGSYETDDSRPFLNGLPSYFDGVNWEKGEFPAQRLTDFRMESFQNGYGPGLRSIPPAFWRRLGAATQRGRMDRAPGGRGRQTSGSPSIRVTGSLLDIGTAVFTTHPNRHSQISFDATLTGTFSFFGLRADTALGGDIARIKLDRDTEAYSGLGPEVEDPLRIRPAPVSEPARDGNGAVDHP